MWLSDRYLQKVQLATQATDALVACIVSCFVVLFLACIVRSSLEDTRRRPFIRPTNRINRLLNLCNIYIYILKILKHLLRIEKSPAYFRLANNFNDTSVVGWNRRNALLLAKKSILFFLSLSFLFLALFIVESRSSEKKITCFLLLLPLFLFSISPIGFLGLFPSFPVVCLSVCLYLF